MNPAAVDLPKPYSRSLDPFNQLVELSVSQIPPHAQQPRYEFGPKTLTSCFSPVRHPYLTIMSLLRCTPTGHQWQVVIPNRRFRFDG